MNLLRWFWMPSCEETCRSIKRAAYGFSTQYVLQHKKRVHIRASFVWAPWGIYFNNPTFTLKLVATLGFFKLFAHCQELSLPLLFVLRKCACSETIYCRVNWPGSECRLHTFKLKTKARCLRVLVGILTSVNAVIENSFVSVNPVIYFPATAALYAHSGTRVPSLYI